VRLSDADFRRLVAKPGVRGVRTGAGTGDANPATGRVSSGRAAPGRHGDGKAQQLLYFIVCAELVSRPHTCATRVETEYAVETVPGKRRGRYRLDVALPEYRIGLELDGFAFHARFQSAFLRHTLRQNAIVLEGWLLLRYTRGMLKHPERICADLMCAIELRQSQRRALDAA